MLLIRENYQSFNHDVSSYKKAFLQNTLKMEDMRTSIRQG